MQSAIRSSDELLDTLRASTSTLVEFVDETSLANIPEPVIERTKVVLLDTLGSMVAASHPKHDLGRKFAVFTEATGGRPESTVVGYERKPPV